VESSAEYARVERDDVIKGGEVLRWIHGGWIAFDPAFLADPVVAVEYDGPLNVLYPCPIKASATVHCLIPIALPVLDAIATGGFLLLLRVIDPVLTNSLANLFAVPPVVFPVLLAAVFGLTTLAVVLANGVDVVNPVLLYAGERFLAVLLVMTLSVRADSVEVFRSVLTRVLTERSGAGVAPASVSRVSI
jgi:hypothetical protein